MITGDETWTVHIKPESKNQSLQWRHTGFPSPKIIQSMLSAPKNHG
jgi:hypothetical protein